MERVDCMSLHVTVIVRKEDDWYIATCLDNNVALKVKRWMTRWMHCVRR